MLCGDIVRRSANRFPDKTAVIWEDTALTYQELDSAANRFAHALHSNGIHKGDHVAIISRNRTEYAIVFFGSAKAGTVLVNIPVQYTSEQFSFALQKADVKMLFIEDLFEPTVKNILGGVPTLAETIVIGRQGSSDYVAFDDFLTHADSDAEPEIDISEDDPFCMTFTGGTTGAPKGVLATHRNRDTTAHTVLVEERLEDIDVVAIVTPMFHVAALNIMFQPAMLAGATCVLQSKWDVETFAKNVKNHGITAGFIVPTQGIHIVSDEAVDIADLETLRKISFAGAPMPDWVQRSLMENLPKLRITQIYGQSEVGVIAALPHRYLPEKLGSVGRQAYNTDIALLDTNGNHVKPGEVGELCSRGANVMREYYNNPEETARFFKKGWGWTGDLGRMDEEGFIYLIDRSKDMLISGGENIYPKEIENAIFLHEHVADCAVIGIPDEKWGEAPVAYVIPHSGVDLTAEELIEHCNKKLSRFKVPHLVLIVDSLPKTSMGKVQKHNLRAQYLEDFGGMAPLLAGQAEARGQTSTWEDN